jgi:hypothetical protein
MVMVRFPPWEEVFREALSLLLGSHSPCQSKGRSVERNGVSQRALPQRMTRAFPGLASGMGDY